MMSEISSTVVLGVFSAALLLVSWKKILFSSTSNRKNWMFAIRWYQVIAVFAIYFACTVFGIAPLAALLLPFFINSPPIAISNWLSFLISSLIFLLIFVYARQASPQILRNIWRHNNETSYSQDIKAALMIWVVSFPFVLFVNQLLDLFVGFIFHVQDLPDQLAVRFLKMTFNYPRYFFLSTLTIVGLAPLLEEILFRGFLQSFVRQHLGALYSVAITSLCFSLFHYSPEQGLANIPIIGSLFILSLFLGWLYEMRGSLIAPITLHALFNALNIITLYFFGDYFTG